MFTDILYAVALNTLSDASLNYSGAYSKEVQLIKRCPVLTETLKQIVSNWCI